jgi:hypothetical protein
MIMTTELLQKVIETVETLPIEEQKTILQRWLCKDVVLHDVKIHNIIIE